MCIVCNSGFKSNFDEWSKYLISKIFLHLTDDIFHMWVVLGVFEEGRVNPLKKIENAYKMEINMSFLLQVHLELKDFFIANTCKCIQRFARLQSDWGAGHGVMEHSTNLSTWLQMDHYA